MDNVKKMEPTDNPSVAQTECKYCKPAAATGEHDKTTCPYCQAMEQAAPADSLASCKYCAGAEDETAACTYCHSIPERGPATELPTTTDAHDYAGQDLNSPEIEKPQVGDQGPIGQTVVQDVPSNTNMNTPPEGVIADPVVPQDTVQYDQSKGAMQQIAAQIEAEETPQSVAQNIDSTQQAVGTTMQDNVSVPAGHDSNVPGDMGLGEEQSADGPDLTAVFQEGLDSQAENIKREKVIQMVGQALEGFKASKKIIEKAQTQAPQLYQSSIMMLKAMIEMANMLGLGQQVNANPQNPLEPAQGQGSEWQDPFPVHPENGGQADPAQQAQVGAPQAAPQGVGTASEWNNPFPVHAENGGGDDSKVGTIGQGIGKLPTAATTQHVAKQPITPGSVNAQGQMRYVDPNTGKESFIDMKQGRVLSPTGKPVKG